MRDGRWQVCLPVAGMDPFLAATLWLVERECAALVGLPPAGGSVHARTLAEAVPVVDPADPGPLAARPGLGLVLVAPGPATLERLDRRAFRADVAVMLVPSAPGDEARVWQDAWVWAQRHDPPRLADRAAPVDPRAFDPAEVLTRDEVWALVVRAGAAPAQAAALRAGRGALVPHTGGARRFGEWRR